MFHGGEQADVTLSFEKYEGIGNDFLVCHLPRPDALSVSQVQKLCDRHYGVGGDGVLIVSPSENGASRGRMTVINADGSQPEMCGNGLRCVALSLLHEGEREAGFVVDTDAGPRHCLVQRDGSEVRVKTSMGRGQLLGSIEHEHDGATFTFSQISMGNPHAVTFAPQLPEAQLDLLGPALSGRIKHGANVEIATMVGSQRIDLSVWERGVGRTLACGTGAAATAVASVHLGLASTDSPIEVHLPGGPLCLTVSDSFEVTLEGPARLVFSGKVAV